MSSGADSLMSFGTLAQWQAAGRLIAGGIRRWRARIVLVTLVFSVTGAIAAAVLPRTYSAEARLLVRKNYVMPALASPRRAVPINSEMPLQSAGVMILSRPSLESIIRERHLLERWERDRAPMLRAKDRITEWIKGPVSEDDKIDALVDLLETRIRVGVEDEVLKISAKWSDRDTVVEIVDGAIDSFLAARRKIDVQTVADTNAILSEFAGRARQQVDEQLAAVARRTVRPVRVAVEPARSTTASAIVASSPSQLRRAIDAARVRVEALEKQHADARAALEARIAERRSVITERHPEMLALRRNLAQLADDPAALIDARRELSDLLAADETTAPVPSSPAVQDQSPRKRMVLSSNTQRIEQRRDEAYAKLAAGATDEVTERLAVADLLEPPAPNEDAVEADRAILKSSIESYQDLRTRLDNVQIELQTAEAAFSHKYSTTVPPQRPRKATSPNVPLVIGGAALAGLLAGIALAISAELKARSLWSLPALRQFIAAEGRA